MDFGGKARAVFERVLGLSYASLGELESSGRILDSAHEWQSEHGEPLDPEVIALDVARVRQLIMSGQRESCLELAREVEQRALRALSPDDEDLIKVQSFLAELCVAVAGQSGDPGHPLFDEAEQRYRANIADWTRVRGPNDTETLGARGGLALCWVSRQRYDAARDELQAVLADCRRVFPEGHFRILNAQINLGIVHHKKNEFAAALEQYEAVTETLLGRFGPQHYYLFPSLANSADCYRQQGRNDEALAIYPEVAALAEKQYGSSAITYAHTMDWASLERQLGNPGRADEILAGLWDRVGGELHTPPVEEYLELWFEVLAQLGRADEVDSLVSQYCSGVTADNGWCAERGQ